MKVRGLTPLALTIALLFVGVCGAVAWAEEASKFHCGGPATEKKGWWDRVFHNQLEGQDQDDAREFLRAVARTYRENVQSNLEFMRKLDRCFAAESDPVSRECAKLRTRTYSLLRKSVFTLRAEFALSHQERRSDPSAGKSIREVRTDLDWRSPFSKNPAGNRPLCGEEYIQAKDTLLREQAEILEQVRQAVLDWERGTSPDDPAPLPGYDVKSRRKMVETAEYNRGVDHRVAMHRERFERELFEKTPILAFLPPARWDGAEPYWEDSEIRKALGKAIINAEKELRNVDQSLQRDTLEFRRNNGQRLFRSFVMGQRDYLDYILFEPVVQRTLEKPEYRRHCRLAEALTQYLENKAVQNELMLGGLFTASGLTIGTVGGLMGLGGEATAGAEAAGVAARIATVAASAYGTAVFAEGYREMADTRGQILSRSGLEEKELPTQLLSRLEEKQKEFLLDAAIAGQGMLKSGTAAYVFARAAVGGKEYVRQTLPKVLGSFRGDPRAVRSRLLSSEGLSQAERDNLAAAFDEALKKKDL